MNNKLKIILLIFLFIIGLSSFIYLNKDFIFKETEVKEQIDAGFNTVNSDTIEYWEKFIV